MKEMMKVNGLVLAGGNSTRMGKDKAHIIYHQKEQMYYMADMLKSMGLDTFISINKKQAAQMDSTYPYLVDKYDNKGPLGGILTAFEMNSRSHWLVIGCDYPQLQRWDMNHIIYESQRQGKSLTYSLPENNLYLPTVAYYQPSMYTHFSRAMENDNLKLQEVLNKACVGKLKPLNSIRFVSANTPEEEKQIRKDLTHE